MLNLAMGINSSDYFTFQLAVINAGFEVPTVKERLAIDSQVTAPVEEILMNLY